MPKPNCAHSAGAAALLVALMWTTAAVAQPPKVAGPPPRARVAVGRFEMPENLAEDVAPGTLTDLLREAGAGGLRHEAVVATSELQRVADWYRADQFSIESRSGRVPVDPHGPSASWDPAEPGVPETAPKRVTRGGSFLCNEAFCLSYRPSARRGTDPYTSMSHIGFRLVMTNDAWRASSAGERAA